MDFCFPVTSLEGETPQWEPLPLKTLKELQYFVKSIGPSAPNTLQIVEMLGSMWLTPYGWHQTAKSTLSPGHFITWKTEYEDRAREVIQNLVLTKKAGKPTVSMLLGREDYASPQEQVSLKGEIVEEVSKIVIAVWRRLHPADGKTTVLAGIKQKQDKPYEDFIARLEEALGRMLPPSEGLDMLLK